MNADGKIIVAIENTISDRINSNDSIAAIFNADSWFTVDLKNGMARLGKPDRFGGNMVLNFIFRRFGSKKSDFPEIAHLSNKWLPIVDFYRILLECLPKNTTLFRVRNFQYPLTELFKREIDIEFPPESFDYVLSTADTCFLEDFFIERLSHQAIETISKMPVAIMPPGYFNGSILERSGRHFPSSVIYNYYLDEHFERMIPSPRQLTLDIMPQCNYACRKCHYHSPLLPAFNSGNGGLTRTKPRQAMSVDTVREVMKRAKSYTKLKSIHAYMAGEPLLHPEIIGVLRVIRDAGFSPMFSTNADLLSREKSLQLLDLGVNCIAFSVDATKPETYKKLLGGDLNKVERNIMTWQELYLQKYPDFCSSMMFVVNSDNIDQMNEFRDRWTARGFTVLFNPEVNVMDHRISNILGHRWDIENKYSCLASTYCLYLDANCDVLVCALQGIPPFKSSGMNFFNASPEEIWRSETLRTARKTFLSGNRLDFCCACCGDCIMSLNTWINEAGHTISSSNAGWFEGPDKDWRIHSDWLNKG